MKRIAMVAVLILLALGIYAESSPMEEVITRGMGDVSLREFLVVGQDFWDGLTPGEQYAFALGITIEAIMAKIDVATMDEDYPGWSGDTILVIVRYVDSYYARPANAGKPVVMAILTGVLGVMQNILPVTVEAAP